MPPEAAQEAPAEPPAQPAPATPGGLDAARGAAAAFYERHRTAVWAAALLGPVLAVGLGWALAPEIVYDQFIWRDLWGSAVADASQRGVAEHRGIVVTEDYTLLSELVYGAIMAVSLYGIYRHVIQRFGIKVDAWFVGAIIPFILFGPVTRTLEDTGMFCRADGLAGCDPSAFAYLFISPFLYAQIAAYVLVFMVAGALLDRSTAPLSTRVGVMGGLLGGAFALYGLVWTLLPGDFTALAHPAVVLGSCAIGLGLFTLLQRKGLAAVNSALLGGGVAFLLPGVWMIGQWLAGDPWGPTILGRLHVDATPAVLGMPLLMVALVAALGTFGKRLDPRLAAFAVPLNLGLVYGHMLDGFASFIAICSNPAGMCQGAVMFGLSLPAYGEKHPVSNLLLGYLDGWLFPIIKLSLVIAIIWVLDVEYKKDLEQEPHLGGLVKMAILVLGLAPGLRDYLRLAMGT